MALTIKEGKWRARNGALVTIVGNDGRNDGQGWIGNAGSIKGLFYCDDGHLFSSKCPDPDDIIAPWKPLRPKPKRKAGRALRPVTPKKFRVRFAYRLTMRISSSHAIKPGNVMLCIGRAVNAKPMDTHHKTTLEALCRLPHHCTIKGKVKARPDAGQGRV